MKILKLTIPGAPTGSSLSNFLDINNREINGWRIHVNESIETADAWFVIENLDSKREECVVPLDSVAFLPAETARDSFFIYQNDVFRKFLEQFPNKYNVSPHYALNVINSLPFLPWMIHANHGKSIWENSEDFVKLVQASPVEKTKLISVFCSDQSLTPNHQLRIEFVKKLKNHFGDRLDWFGNGFNPVATKREGLSNYKYTIVLENQARFNIITEKIYDAFIERCFPFYWGAPNLSTYFDSRGFEPINIEDAEGAISIIEHAISQNYYGQRVEFVSLNRNLVLHEMNFINRIIDLATRISAESSNQSELVQLADQASFSTLAQTSKIKLVSLVHEVLVRLDQKMGTNFDSLSIEIYKLLRYNRLSAFLRKIN